jgi:quercetin dioxygenase-like cupin family protein
MVRDVTEHGAGRVLELPGGVRARVHVTGRDSGGAFTLLTDEAPPGWSLPPHRHANESETIHIVSGTLWLDLEGEHRELEAGETAFIPRGSVHSGGTLGAESVRRVLVFAPAGMEDFFAALADSPDPAAAAELARAYGWTFA